MLRRNFLDLIEQSSGAFDSMDIFKTASIFFCACMVEAYIRRAMSSEGKQNKQHWLTQLPFDKWNYGLFFIGLVVIILGYILMGTGGLNSTQSLTVSPIVLLIGYLVIIPVAIMFHKRDRKQPED